VLDFSFEQSRSTAVILIENPTRVAEIFVSSISSPGELELYPLGERRATIKAHPATPRHSRHYMREFPSEEWRAIDIGISIRGR
jgi:hypothetical protein